MILITILIKYFVEDSRFKPGDIEKRVVQALMDRIHKEINPLDFAFLSDAEIAAAAMFESLLDMPFDNETKTARDIILEERRRLNNPLTEIKYEISFVLDELTQRSLAQRNYERACELLDNNKFKDAIELFESVLDNFSDNPEIYKNLGYAYYKLSRIYEAKMCFQRVLDLKPNDEFVVKSLKEIKMIESRRTSLTEKRLIELPTWMIVEELRRRLSDFELKDFLEIAQIRGKIDDIFMVYLQRLRQKGATYPTISNISLIKTAFRELRHRCIPGKIFADEFYDNLYDLLGKLDTIPRQKRQERASVASEILKAILSPITVKVGEKISLDREIFVGYNNEVEDEIKGAVLYCLDALEKAREWHKLLFYSDRLWNLFEDTSFLKKKALAYFGLKRFKEGKEIYEELIAQEPSNISNLINYGNLCIRYLKDKRLAKEIYQRALFKVQSGLFTSYEREEWINIIFCHLREITDDPKEMERLESQKVNSILSPQIRTYKKVGRNEPCPCGSGKKYKKCCGRVV